MNSEKLFVILLEPNQLGWRFGSWKDPLRDNNIARNDRVELFNMVLSTMTSFGNGASCSLGHTHSTMHEAEGRKHFPDF